MNMRLKSAGLAALVATLPALADIKINDNLTISGYAAGAYEYQKVKNLPATDSLFDGTKDTPSADAALLMFTGSFKPVTGVLSLYYVPNLPKNELTLLDAYVTYDVGSGFSVTGGKFLSYLGYEAFHTVYMNQITYGLVTVGTLGAIPTYHSGVRLDYGDKDVSYGVALVDSVYSPYGFARGDGELKHNAGFEAFFKYSAITDLTLWAGFAYDTKGNFQPHSVTIFDVWAEYKLSKAATVAAEVCTKDGGEFAKGYTWLTYLNYAFDEKFSTVFRITGENLSGKTKTTGNNAIQYTVSPGVKLTDHLTVRAEVTYYDYKDNVYRKGLDKTIYGVQAVFKF